MRQQLFGLSDSEMDYTSYVEGYINVATKSSKRMDYDFEV